LFERQSIGAQVISDGRRFMRFRPGVDANGENMATESLWRNAFQHKKCQIVRIKILDRLVHSVNDHSIQMAI